MRALLICLLALSLFSCSSDAPDPADLKDGGTDSESDGGTTTDGPEFAYEVVAGLETAADIGDNARLALQQNGEPAVAYGVVPAQSTERQIHVAERQSDGTWTSEMAIIPGANAPGGGDLVGLGFDYVDGTPHLAYIGGDDDGNPLTPFPTDLMLATRQGGWSERTLVDTSGEAPATCDEIQDYCNFGGVVGTHASLAARPGGGGFAVIYRDTHNGFARDDLARSDTEVYAEGGPFTNSNVDPVRGTGSFADVAWLSNGNLVTAYALEEPHPNEDRLGVWAAYYDGADWQPRRVSPSLTTARVALAVAPDDTIWLAFHASDGADLVVAKSDDGGESWQSEIVDGTGKSGLYPSIAVDTEDRPVVAYTYCGKQSDRDCPGKLGGDSVVRLARLEGGEWKLYTIDDGDGFGGVGLFNSIAVLPDGKLGVAFKSAETKDLIFTKEL